MKFPLNFIHLIKYFWVLRYGMPENSENFDSSDAGWESRPVEETKGATDESESNTPFMRIPMKC